MIIGIGTDIVEVQRVKEAIDNYDDKFLKRIFTQNEIDYCESYKLKKYVHYAARFSAKESFSKAIGTGITKDFKWTDFGIINEASGKPIAELSDSAKEKYGDCNILISLSHTDNNAASFVVLEK